MNRKSFIKSLVTLFAAPSVIKDIDFTPKAGIENIGYTQIVKPMRIQKDWCVTKEFLTPVPWDDYETALERERQKIIFNTIL